MTDLISVLIVDDAPDVRRLVRTALRFRGGFEVVGEAGTCAEATALAERLRPDVVVLDLHLPDITGRDVLTSMRRASTSTEVVIFSGAEPTDAQWFDDNAAGYVLKDSDLDYLVDLLEHAGRRSLEASATARLELPLDLGSVKLARQFVRERLRAWGLESMVDDAFLVVSELAANALTHAESAYEVRMALASSTVRIEVRDNGAGTPEPQPPTMTEDHGRGLLMVSALSSSWGIEQVPDDGKVVWAELARR